MLTLNGESGSCCSGVGLPGDKGLGGHTEVARVMIVALCHYHQFTIQRANGNSDSVTGVHDWVAHSLSEPLDK